MHMEKIMKMHFCTFIRKCRSIYEKRWILFSVNGCIQPLNGQWLMLQWPFYMEKATNLTATENKMYFQCLFHICDNLKQNENVRLSWKYNGQHLVLQFIIKKTLHGKHSSGPFTAADFWKFHWREKLPLCSQNKVLNMPMDGWIEGWRHHSFFLYALHLVLTFPFCESSWVPCSKTLTLFSKWCHLWSLL